MEGDLQLGNKIEAEDFSKRPLRTSSAILVAFLLAILWERHWDQACRRLLRGSQAAPPSTSTTSRVTSIFSNIWRRLKLMTLLSLSSGGLLWILVYSLCTLTSKPMLLFRIKVVIVFKVCYVLAILLIDTFDYIKLRLRRRPTGRHISHDTPCVELQGRGREPM